MDTYIGLDIGTSSLKAVLVDGSGREIASVSRGYPLSVPGPGRAEQDPGDWVRAALSAIGYLVSGRDALSVRGIGVAGQMHGLVTLDCAGNVIRPAILWNDGRALAEAARLNTGFAGEKTRKITGNAAFPGFTAPKIMWMRENEPELYKRISKVLLPKDYVIYALTGIFTADVTDASGTCLADLGARCWSSEMCGICGVKEDWLPDMHESYEKVGVLKRDIADMFGLDDVTVCAGAGDNAAAALGCGAVNAGDSCISLGTSGTISYPADNYPWEGVSSLHSFAHADGRYLITGCILSAASCASWWAGNILESTNIAAEQEGLERMMGENGVFFLPYLAGERCPHDDVNARGAFIGLSRDTDRAKMTLAVFEGVCYALKECAERAGGAGLCAERAILCGGGAASPLWVSLTANILGLKVYLPGKYDPAASGAAVLAATACGRYGSVSEAAGCLAENVPAAEPDEKISRKYAEKYAIYRSMYPALRDVFSACGREKKQGEIS